LLWGLLRSRLARGGLPDLFRELGTPNPDPAVAAVEREVLERAFRGPVTTQVPASLLRLHGDVTLVLDEAAAAPGLRR